MTRLESLVMDAHALLDRAIDEEFSRHKLGGIVTLFSGGNDSTVLAHLFRHRATHAGHANTTVGIEQTRQFVRDTCAAWDLPLLEIKPPRTEDHYRELVLAHGFPGPAQHFKMYQRLKERSLDEIRRELIGNRWRTERIIFLAGRRRSESRRRAEIPELERKRSIVWCSPLAEWTAADLMDYRRHFRPPRNEAADLLHMSGECLCGSFATPSERAEILDWFPTAFDEIAELERLIADRDDIPAERRRWGWGAGRDRRASASGPLCSSCVAR